MNKTLPVSIPFLVVGSALVGGCVGDPPAPMGLHIERHDAALLAGTFRVADEVARFDAVMPRELAGVVHVDVGDARLTLEADAATGIIRFDAGDAPLSAADHELVVAMTAALDAHLGPVDGLEVMHESTLLAAAHYFVDAPIETQIPARTQYVEPLEPTTIWSTGNDGKTCITRGSSVTARYDGDQGTTSETLVVGSNGGTQWNGDFSCMGRCGVGCGSYDWTLDCLEHDACSRRYFSSSGVIDHNCGDEYSEAADDYTAFWKRCY
jgi:hypothetical protein